MKHSLAEPSKIPAPNRLKAKLQSLAMLDAILMSDWEMRYFSFNSKWASNEMLGSMRDGEGADFFFLFCKAGAVGKIFSNDDGTAVDRTDVQARIPQGLASFAKEPAFNLENITCALWREANDSKWTILPSSQGPIPWLSFIGDEGEYYWKWAKDCYEASVSLPAVLAIFQQQVLTRNMVFLLNEDADFETILVDAAEIGYPVGG